MYFVPLLFQKARERVNNNVTPSIIRKTGKVPNHFNEVYTHKKKTQDISSDQNKLHLHHMTSE